MVLKVTTNLMPPLAPGWLIKARERWRGQGRRKLSGKSLIPLVLAVTPLAVMKVFAGMMATKSNPVLALR